METIFKEYFADLDEAREFANKKRAELKETLDCYFDCSVWDCTDPWNYDNRDHWINGEFLRYVVIAVKWPNNI